MTAKTNRRNALVLAAGGAALTLPLLALSPALAAKAPVSDSLTVSSSSVAVGQTVHVTGTATNNTSAPVNVRVGVTLPAGLKASNISYSHCTGRRFANSLYCGMSHVNKGAQAALSFDVTFTAAGSYAFSSYAGDWSSAGADRQAVTVTVG